MLDNFLKKKNNSYNIDKKEDYLDFYFIFLKAYIVDGFVKELTFFVTNIFSFVFIILLKL